MEWLMYLLKVSACLLAFYALYFLFFKNKTFFHANRFYLLTSLLVSFIIPLTQLSVPASTMLPNTDVWNIPIGQFHGNTLPIMPDTSSDQTDYATILFVIYIIGIIVLMVRLARSLRMI